MRQTILHRALRNLVEHPLLGFALLAQTLSIGLYGFLTARLSSEHTMPWQSFWQVLILGEGLVLLSLFGAAWHALRSQRQPVDVLEAKLLIPQLLRYLHTFSGEVLIYNIELNTLAEHRLWSALCTRASITNIAIALPPHIFRRLEDRLRDSSLFDTLSPGAHKLGFMIARDDPAWSRTAFAVFKPARPSLIARPLTLLFYKTGPCSTLKATSDPKTTIWDYEYYSSTHDLSAQISCDKAFARVVDATATFTLADVHKLALGKSEAAPLVAAAHRLTKRVSDQLVTSIQPSRGRIPYKLREGDTPTFLSIDSTRGRYRVYLNNPSGTTSRPVLLWMPPWGVPNWRDYMAPYDARLAEHYLVAHLTYSGQTRHYTFSGAAADAEDALATIFHLRDQLRCRTDHVALVGVSVNAFLAAELAARAPSVRSLCMLMCAVDLMDALDSFRRVDQPQLWSRKIYCGKEQFCADHITAAMRTYFGQTMSVLHLLDLPCRGAARCNEEFLVANLTDFVSREGASVLMGHSRQDTMTPWESADRVSEAVGRQACRLLEIGWFHDVQSGVRYGKLLRQENPAKSGEIARAEQGMEEVVDWLLTRVAQ